MNRIPFFHKLFSNFRFSFSHSYAILFSQSTRENSFSTIFCFLIFYIGNILFYLVA